MSIERCESGGCIEVTNHDGHIRIRSTITSTTCQSTVAEFVSFRARVKAGEFDHIGEEVEVNGMTGLDLETIVPTIELSKHYTSTACHHDLHHRCRIICKFCDQACRCECHDAAPVTALAAEDDAPYEQADQQLADIERRVAADRAVIDAAKVRAQVLRDLLQFGSGSDGWYERNRESDQAILIAVDALGPATGTEVVA